MAGRSACALVAATGLACGGQGPTTPRRPPLAPAHLAFAVTPEIGNRSVVDFTWGDTPAADRFQVEVGTLSGASDVAVIRTGSADDSYRWTPAPIGVFFARVRGENSAGVGDPSNEVKVASIDPRDLIEALFLQSGPMRASTDRRGGIMTGWTPGEQFSVTVGSSLTAEQYSAVEQTIAQVPAATAGTISAVVGRTNDLDPLPHPGEITVAKVPDEEVHELCGSAAAGCTIYYAMSGRYIRSVRVVGTDQAIGAYLFVHELGHAAFGFGHVKIPDGFWPPPIMATEGSFIRPPGLTRMEPSEVKASGAVYAAGLYAGSTGLDFRAAGLIAPLSTGSTSFGEDASWNWPGARVYELPGGDLIVVKPFCDPPSRSRHQAPTP